MKKIFGVALLATLIVVQSVSATPSSIIRIPSLDVQPYGTFHLGIDNNTTMFRTEAGGAHADDTVFGLTTGLMDTGMLKIEGGFDIREPEDKSITLNGKIVLPEGSFGDAMPALAFGVYDFGTATENDFDITYFEVGKTIGFLGRFALGYFVGNSKHMKNSSGNDSSNGLLFSFDRRLPEINERLWFGIDFQGSDSQYGALAFGFSWSFSENAGLVVGFVRNNQERAPGAGTSTITWQVDFDF